MKWRAILIAWLLISTQAFADELLMARIAMKADLAVEYLKSSVEEHGYSVAHIQLCDGGMADFGYKSDVYRVVFFGKLDEVRRISQQHPEFASYMPLKMTVVAERDETVLTAVNPRNFDQFYPDDRQMRIQFGRWKNDIESIFVDLQRAVVERAKQGL